MGVDPRDPRYEDETVVDETRVVDDEGEVVHRREHREPKRPLIWPWLLLLLLLVAVGIGAYVYFTEYADEDTKPVPNVVGQTLEQAVAALQAEGFTTAISRGNDEAEPGIVFQQDPEGGAEAEDGSAVGIVVSEGPATRPVPQVTGLTEADARDALGDAGFEVNAVEIFSDEPEGTVAAQNPAAETEANVGSTVRINVSKGSGETEVPELVGLTEDEAKQQLDDAGLQANVVSVPSQEPEGTVVAQNPAPGTTVQQDSLLRLNVSSGSSP